MENAADQGAEGPAFLRGIRPALLLAAACLLLYAPALLYGPTWLDDAQLFAGNLPLLKLSNLPLFFTSDVSLAGAGVYYRPLLNVSLALDALGGGGWLVPHATNLLLHAAAAALLFFFLVRLGRDRLPAFLLALLFLAHPALAQGAAWIPGRNDSLLLLFALPAFLACAEYARSRGFAALAAYAGALAAALLTKETAALLPPLALGYLFLVREERPPRSAWAPPAAVSALLLAGWALARHAVLAGPAGGGMAERFAVNLPELLGLFGDAVLPLARGVWLAPGGPRPAFGAAALALLALVPLSRVKVSRLAWFGLAWFLLFTLPALGASFDPVRAVSTHRLYLPLAGLAVFLSELPGFGAPGKWRGAGRAAYLAVLLLFAAAARMQSGFYSGGTAFWGRAVQEAPLSPQARMNFGAALHKAGRPDLAEAQYRAALDLFPGVTLAHYNLGLLYAEQGRAAEAGQEFDQELQLNPAAAAAVEEARAALPAR